VKGFEDFQFDPSKLAAECAALAAVLQPKKGLELSEKYVLAPAVTAAKNVLATVAMTFGGVSSPNLWAAEYWVHDKLRCDYVYADSRTRRFCFIEIEDARKNSVFVQKHVLKSGTAAPTPYYEWAPRFDHGTSQLLDWIRLIQDQHQTEDFKDHFGDHNEFTATFILIIGRAEYLSPSQQRRLDWRSKNVITSNYKVQAFTFDDLLEEGQYQLGLQATQNPFDPAVKNANDAMDYEAVAAMLGLHSAQLRKMAAEWAASGEAALDSIKLADRIKAIQGGLGT
jgi:hypothetical protein